MRTRPKSVTKQGERYGTPKVYQSRWFKRDNAPSKKKYPCIKLKGEHNFEVVEVSKYTWFDPNKYWTTERCTACGKKKVSFK